ncbi:MAG: hypothetical protein COB15_11945 [Flavobacteriales bacterium]|nr:MAG: hypothetical protein COB15_11945 [Flavobacteriales bacterium]
MKINSASALLCFLILVTGFSNGQTPVVWTDLVGVSLDANGNPNKTAAYGWSNAGVASKNKLMPQEDGSASIKIDEQTNIWVFGLSTKNKNERWSSINYAFLKYKKTIYIYEKGRYVGRYGRSKIGDELKIARAGNYIRYYKNGKQLHSTPSSKNKELIIDATLINTGTTLTGVQASFCIPLALTATSTANECGKTIGAIDLTVEGGIAPYTYNWSNGTSTADITNLSTGEYTVTVTDAESNTKTLKVTISNKVVWTDLVGVSLDANGNPNKTAAYGWSNAGLASKNKLLPQEDGNASIKIDEQTNIWVFGLSTKNKNERWSSINYAFLKYKKTIYIYEKGRYVGRYGRCKLGDELKIAREGDYIRYYKNGKQLHSTPSSNTQELIIDVTLINKGTTLTGVQASFCNFFSVDYTVFNESPSGLGSVKLAPYGGTPPYYYFWSDGGAGADRNSIESGVYNVTVTDANNESITLKIVVGMELEFANLSGLDVLNNEDLLKTAEDGYGNAMATFNNVVDGGGDGEVRVEIADPTKEFTFGFRDEANPQATDYTGLSYGIYVTSNSELFAYDSQRGEKQIGSVEEGDVISIEKINIPVKGDFIYFKKNDEVLHRVLMTTVTAEKRIELAAQEVSVGRVVEVNETTSTIMSLTDGKECTCKEKLSDLAVVGSTVSYKADADLGVATEVIFPVELTASEVTLCDVKKVELPVFKIDFSLGSNLARVRKIRIIKFSVTPKIKATIDHAACYQLNSGAIKINLRGGVPPFTYSWIGPDSYTSSTKDVEGLVAGDYNLTVTDSWFKPHVVTKNYQVRYTVNIVETTNCRATSGTDGYTKNSISKSELCTKPKEDGTAETLNKLEENKDGGIFYEVDQVGYTKTFGLGVGDGTKAAAETNNNFGIQLDASGELFILEQSGKIEGEFGNFQLGDVIEISRIGNQIVYKRNQEVLRSTTTNPSLVLIAKFKLNQTCASFNNLYTDFCSQKLFTINSKGIIGVDSYTISGAGINETVTTGTERSFIPIVSNGETATIQIVATSTEGIISTILVEINEDLEVFSSSLRVDNGTTVRDYGVDNYLKTGGVMVFSLSQLVAEIAAPPCSADDNRNWTASKFFDEDGNLVSSGKSYFNHLGNSIQTQSKNFTENTVIASETVYDAYGRAVLTTLPAPIYETSFCYKEGFIESNNGNEYDYTQFDVPNYTTMAGVVVSGEVDNPTPVKNIDQGSVGWYYSNNNTEEPYVATTYYPYSRVEYDVNNPGSVKRSSSPHNALKMGSKREAKSFSMPASGELNYVFGYARGWIIQEDVLIVDDIFDWFDVYLSLNTDLLFSYNVTKNITVDADGNEGVTFVDYDGKTIATCYSGKDDNGTNARNLLVTSFIQGQDMAERYIDIHLPEGTETSIEIGNQVYNNSNYYEFDILDLDKNVYVYQGVDGQSINLSPGYYRIINTKINFFNTSNLFKDPIPIRYNLNYYDFSLYYYDKAGRLITTVSPNGFDNSYDPNIIITTASNRKQFVEDGCNIPFFNPGYKVEVPLTPTPNGSQQFSFALPYLTEYNNHVVVFDPSLGSDVGKMVGARGLSSGLSPLIVTSLGDGSPPTPAKGPIGPCDDSCDDCLDPGNYTSAQAVNYARIKCDGFNRDYELYEPKPEKNYYCIKCIPRPQPSIERFYVVTIDVKSNDGTILTPDIRLTASRHNPHLNTPYSSDVFWEFDVIPQQLMADNGEGSLIDLTLSNTATSVKVIVTNVVEFKRNYDNINLSWHFVPSCDYIYINELDLNLTTVTHEFPGGYPHHNISSISQYNSISQVLKTVDEDEGVADYVYSEEGLLRFSRNDKQKAENKFSYTNYDELGRPIESGEYDENFIMGGSPIYFQNHYKEYTGGIGLPTTDPNVLDNLNYSGISLSGKTFDVTYSEYDYPDPNFNLTGYDQKVYLGDVSKTWTKPTPGTTIIPFTTWYSYDMQGRVMWMVQGIKGLGYKTIDYVYNTKGDLEQVIYQKNYADYFAHKYTYDADKRLSNVETKDSPTNSWKQQAKYYYYQHGPLKRTELADNLQGIDYLYNTLGQLKAINSPNLGETGANQFIDPGKDGILNNFATDVFGMSIDYFSGDYARANTFVNSGITQNENYNGNIKSVRWNTDGIAKPTNANQWMYNYEYNKKQWLKQATFGQYTHGLADFEIFTPNDHYKVSNLTYDPNGNILSLDRNAYNTGTANSEQMDQLQYVYSGNKLLLIDDVVPNFRWTTDIDSDYQPQTQSTDYTYDEIGQLVDNKKDDQYFTYNVSGLVTHVHKDANRANLIAQYFYDDKGYRYKKALYNAAGTTVEVNTYYIRDAAGTIQHIYTADLVQTTNSSEYPIYASGRIGNYYKGGDYVYELSDYLGNVRATVSQSGAFNPPLIDDDFTLSSNGTAGWVGTNTNAATPSWFGGVLIVQGNLGVYTVEKTVTTVPGTVYQLNFELDNSLNYLPNFVEVLDGTSSIKKVTTSSIGNYSFTFIATSTSTTIKFTKDGLSTGTGFYLDDVLLQQYSYDAVVESFADYYPFGEKLPGAARNYTSSLLYKYTYQGQEHDEETGLEAFELRLWDGRMGRWLSTDPYGQYHSPYLGMGNNPIGRIDPDGGKDGDGVTYVAYGPEFTITENRSLAYYGYQWMFGGYEQFSIDVQKHMTQQINDLLNGRRGINLIDVGAFGDALRNGSGLSIQEKGDLLIWYSRNAELAQLGKGFGMAAAMAPVSMITGGTSSSMVSTFSRGLSGASKGGSKLIKNSGFLYDSPYKTILKTPFKNGDRYLSGFYTKKFRFQFHKHRIKGSTSYLPHLNFNNTHIMLNKNGVRQIGFIYRGGK